MQKVWPCLWFDIQAEEAARFYVSVFPNSRIVSVEHYPQEDMQQTPLSVEFELDGLRLQAINGGPAFPFTEAVSFVVTRETQDEIDRLWDTLIGDGGSPGQCGWLKDRFGLSWQVVPAMLPRLLADPDREKANRVMQTMLPMTKLDIDQLQAAYDAV